MTAEIHIYGSTSKLTGDFPLDEVREATSWLVDGHKYAKAYKKGVWDGRKHLFNSKTGAFPTGLVKTVAGVLSAADVDYNTVDHRTDPASIQGDVHITGPDDAFRLHGVSFTGKYDYQATACRDMVLAKQGIVRIATNGGKCLAPETLVLRYDGTQVAAQDVQLGDKLMGPDSEPRNVLATTKDRGPMYRIIPNKGEPWDCNDVHVLTLVHTVTGKVVDIPLNEYLQQTNTFKHCHKLFQPDVVVFENPVYNLPVDPYFAGLWLGDGRKSLQGLQITTADHEIVAYLQHHMQHTVSNGSVSKYQYSDECPTYALVTPRGCKNPLLEKMRSTFTSVRIPHEYLTSTHKNRVSLLAGLVDSDGYHHNGSYEITQKRKGLAEDICFLARSLGFRATMKAKVVKQFDPKGVTYWRVSIVGDLSQVPVILDRKKAYPRKHKWNALRQGFKVEPLGTGDYAGFELDGNGRFLLGDFTVTHNTEIACGVTKYLDVKTLFIVTSKDLLHQARARFAERLGLPLEEIGIIGDNNWEPGEWVTISTLDTLESRMDTAACQRFLKSIELMFVDECHHVGSETWYTVSTLCDAFYRFGLSGTPLDRADGANLRLVAATGDLIVDISNKFLVDRGVSARANIVFDKISGPALKKGSRYNTVYKQGVVENEQLNDKVIEWTKLCVAQNLSVLVLIEEIGHGRQLDEALWTKTDGVFIPHQFIWGDETTEVRTEALQDFGERKLPVLIASTILDEGVDVPTIDVIILAGSRKSKIRTLQRLGRGLRGDKLIVIEFSNFCHHFLLDHSLKRFRDYKNEECFPMFHSSPDAALIKRLWDA